MAASLLQMRTRLLNQKLPVFARLCCVLLLSSPDGCTPLAVHDLKSFESRYAAYDVLKQTTDKGQLVW